jgi:hypothetical protein
VFQFVFQIWLSVFVLVDISCPRTSTCLSNMFLSVCRHLLLQTVRPFAWSFMCNVTCLSQSHVISCTVHPECGTTATRCRHRNLSLHAVKWYHIPLFVLFRTCVLYTVCLLHSTLLSLSPRNSSYVAQEVWYVSMSSLIVLVFTRCEYWISISIYILINPVCFSIWHNWMEQNERF